MYMTDHIFTILPIKNLVHNDGGPTTPQKLATDTKTSVSKIRVLFCPCVVISTKSINMVHHSQKVFRGIFFGIPQNKKVYLIYVPIPQKNSFFTYCCTLQKGF